MVCHHSVASAYASRQDWCQHLILDGDVTVFKVIFILPGTSKRRHRYHYSSGVIVNVDFVSGFYIQLCFVTMH